MNKLILARVGAARLAQKTHIVGRIDVDVCKKSTLVNFFEEKKQEKEHIIGFDPSLCRVVRLHRGVDMNKQDQRFKFVFENMYSL